MPTALARACDPTAWALATIVPRFTIDPARVSPPEDADADGMRERDVAGRIGPSPPPTQKP